MVKIDISTNTTSLIGDDLSNYEKYKYKDGVVGEDYNIYAIPYNTNRVTKFNTTTQEMSKVGSHYDGLYK